MTEEYIPTAILDLDEDEPATNYDFAEPTRVYQPTQFLPHQWEAYTFNCPSEQGTIAVLGAWGSAKTSSGAQLSVQAGVLNPWREDYGRSHPVGWIVAPTFRILKNATVAEFDKFCPPELIRKRVNMPHPAIHLVNGFEWRLMSAKGEKEGETVAAIWGDEIQHPLYQPVLPNLQGRIRDKLSPWRRFIATGLPTSGFVRDSFDRPDDPTVKTILAATKDNPHIPPETLRDLMAMCPSGMEGAFLNGQWMSPIGVIYSQFSPDSHLVDLPIGYKQQVHIGMDVGNFGGLLIAQKRMIRTNDKDGKTRDVEGLYIIDEILTNNEGVEQQCHRLKNSAYIIGRGSTFCVDPTIRVDEMNIIRRIFPGVRIVSLQRGDDYFPVENGIRQVQRALRDALGNIRLIFNRRLVGTKRGIIESLETYRRSDVGRPVRDNTTDHILDCLRYLVCEHVPFQRMELRTIQL